MSQFLTSDFFYSVLTKVDVLTILNTFQNIQSCIRTLKSLDLALLTFSQTLKVLGVFSLSEDGKTMGECMKKEADGVSTECRATIYSFYECRRSMLDMRTRFRGRKEV
nr:cytochrome c oxidase assembly factor 5 isoform X1 [Hydra vulgaris]